MWSLIIFIVMSSEILLALRFLSFFTTYLSVF